MCHFGKINDERVFQKCGKSTTKKMRFGIFNLTDLDFAYPRKIWNRARYWSLFDYANSKNS